MSFLLSFGTGLDAIQSRAMKDIETDGWVDGRQSGGQRRFCPLTLEQHPRDYYIYKWALRTSRENILKGFIFKSLMPIVTITILGSFEWDIWLKSPNWRQIPSNLSKRPTDTFGSKYNYLSS